MVENSNMEPKEIEDNSDKKMRGWHYIKSKLPTIQLFTVTFGVLLGFWINGLRQSYLETKRAEAAISQINRETLKNLKEVEGSLVNNLYVYRKLLDLEKTVKVVDHKMCFADLFQHSFITPSFSTSAFESTIHQGVSVRMSMDMLIAISEINHSYSSTTRAVSNLQDVYFSRYSLIKGELPTQLRLVKQNMYELMNQNMECRTKIIAYFKQYKASYLKDTIPIGQIVKKTLSPMERRGGSS